MSARTRELFALIPVALLVTAGFTAVLITNSDKLGNLSVLYGAYFLAVCVATHIVIRIRLPDADPFLFPLVALLAAFGLVMLYRLDEGLARDQANWFVLGLVLFSATIIFLRDYEALERYRYLIALVGIVLLILPRFLGHATNDAYLAVNLGPVTFQPTELAKICIVVFLASYLNERREVLVIGARKFAGLVLPPLKHLGPLLVVWGAAMVLLVFIRDLGSSVMFFGAFLALIYVATARISFVIIGLLMFVLGAWFFAHTTAHIQRALRHLARPIPRPERQRLPALPVHLRPGGRRALRPRPRRLAGAAARLSRGLSGQVRDPAGPPHRLHLCRDRR